MTVDWNAYAKGVEADIAEIKEYLAPLESDLMTLGSREGNCPWRDAT
jgi:hypothetical protein